MKLGISCDITAQPDRSIDFEKTDCSDSLDSCR